MGWTAEEIAILEAIDQPRRETGVIKFGNDWPGVFIRGDEALAFAGALRAMKLQNGIIDEIITLFEACKA